jgi:transposase-like protein
MPPPGAEPPPGRGPSRDAPQPTCPFCDAPDVERVAQFGGQLMTSQWRCRGCGSYFEAVRDEFLEDRPVPGTH